MDNLTPAPTCKLLTKTRIHTMIFYNLECLGLLGVSECLKYFSSFEFGSGKIFVDYKISIFENAQHFALHGKTFDLAKYLLELTMSMYKIILLCINSFFKHELKK